LKIWAAQALSAQPHATASVGATVTTTSAHFTADHPHAAPLSPPTPGLVLQANAHGLDVATGDGVLRLLQLQKPGGKRLAVADFLRGTPDGLGQILGA
jgi:methionyl-tRNA formyltransferase